MPLKREREGDINNRICSVHIISVVCKISKLPCFSLSLHLPPTVYGGNNCPSTIPCSLNCFLNKRAKTKIKNLMPDSFSNKTKNTGGCLKKMYTKSIKRDLKLVTLINNMLPFLDST